MTVELEFNVDARAARAVMGFADLAAESDIDFDSHRSFPSQELVIFEAIKSKPVQTILPALALTARLVVSQRSIHQTRYRPAPVGARGPELVDVYGATRTFCWDASEQRGRRKETPARPSLAEGRAG